MADDDDAAIAGPTAKDEQDRREPVRRRLSDEFVEERDAFWLEIERDIDRELAEPERQGPARELVDDNPDPRENAQAGEEEEQERRLDTGSHDRQARPSPASREASTSDKEREEAGQVDRTFPDEIVKSYYVRADHLGHQHVYADSRGLHEIFQESGDKLRTRLDEPHCVKLMLETAAHRGWSSISVNGTGEFRREAWLEGQARGIAVSGYKPTELDLQELKHREQEHLRNEILPEREHLRNEREEADRPAPDPQRLYDRGGHSNPSTEPDGLIEKSRADRGPADYKQGIEGKLIDQGSRPYQDRPKADRSPYIVLEDKRGRQHTVWGVGLPDAMLKAGARQGDQVRLREAGMERVTKNVIREIDGRRVRVQQQVDRRAWEAEVTTRERDRAGRDHGDERKESDSTKEPQDRQARLNKADGKIARAIGGAERSLHVGAGRDRALDDGIYANEARAREYMAAGRSAAFKNPELRGAATLEAYIERKVRRKFAHDPVAVQRAMAVARTRISHAIARGYDFPQPRVVDKDVRDRADGARDRNNRDRPSDPGSRPVAAMQSHEQNREQERAVDRDQSRQQTRKLDRAREH